MPEFRGLASLAVQLKPLASLTGPVSLVSVPRGPEALISLHIFASVRRLRPCARAMVILCENNKDISRQLAAYSGSDYEILSFPDLPLWGQDRYINHRNLEHARLQTLSHLSHSEKPCLIFTSLSSLSRWCPAPERFRSKVRIMSSGDILDQEDFITELKQLGYQESHTPGEPGSFGLRGGIIDLCNTGQEGSVRIEFFGDLISSLHRFNPETGRSEAKISDFALTPAYELLWDSSSVLSEWKQKLHLNLIAQKTPDWERHGMTESLGEGIRFSGFNLFTPLFQTSSDNLFSYLSQDSLFFSLRPLSDYDEMYRQQLDEMSSDWQNDQDSQKPGMSPDLHYQHPDETVSRCQTFLRFEAGSHPDSDPLRTLSWKGSHFKSPELTSVSDPFAPWHETFTEILDRQGRIFIFCQSEYEQEKILTMAKGKGFTVSQVSGPEACLEGISQHRFPGQCMYLTSGSLSQTWYDFEGDHLFLPSQVFGAAKPGKKTGSDKKKLRSFLNSFKDLKEGDLVVHSQHGIAKYAGLKKISPGGSEGEFLQLRYHGGDHIYLPVDRINNIQKFHTGGEGGRSPGPDRLRGQGFQERKQKTAKIVEDIAEDLLRQDALRKLAKRKPCLPPDEIYHQFVDDFPYEETGDQLKVIDDIEADLSSRNPMDRIIVGDVGFGKTEVAMRSCMRMVLSGFQVMVLVPTTVLCYQHHKNFAGRLEKYGVRVEALNRFIKAKDAKIILEDVNAGAVDVLVGTHRILSKDINPPKLRLIIIDEEHRFGVVHKERLKRLKASADILTLTATPIPRTLHMAMIGLRDISLMTEPPPGRLPVRTMLSSPEDQLIQEAIRLEVSRGGQVFCLYNRVRDIQETCNRIRNLVPGVSVEYAHGQMHQNQLEKTLVDFIEQKFHVLVCTTIIESGIDMPNVNTMLIFDAEAFGLAQLYQLRGRVGRSGVQAYTWLFSKQHNLSDEARKRLDTLTAHQDPGSGFYIAGADLEMRGAGNLLGGEQSGHAHGVGYEMYSRMLENEIRRQRGESVEEIPDPEIQTLQKALLPEHYIQDASERLREYKRIFAAETEEEMDDIFSGLRERFGKAPEEVLNLREIAKIKIILKKLKVKKISEKTSGHWEAAFLALDETFLGSLSGFIWSDQVPALSLGGDFSLKISCPRLQDLCQILRQLSEELATPNAQNHSQS